MEASEHGRVHDVQSVFGEEHFKLWNQAKSEAANREPVTTVGNLDN